MKRIFFNQSNPIAAMNPAVWLEAGVGETLNGTTLSGWASQLGENDAAQTTEANQPTPTQHFLNGRRAIVSSDGARYMRIPDFAHSLTNFSVFVVADIPTHTSKCALFAHYDYGADQESFALIRDPTASDLKFRVIVSADGSHATAVQVTAPNTGLVGPTLFDFTFNNGTGVFGVGGVDVHESSGFPSACHNSTADLTIMATLTSDTPTDLSVADSGWSEIIFLNETAPDSKKAIIRNYLKSKYGV